MTSTTLPKNFLSVEEVANQLQCSIQHVRHLARKGKLNGIQFAIGNLVLWRIDPKSVKQYQALSFTRGRKRGKPNKH